MNGMIAYPGRSRANVAVAAAELLHAGLGPSCDIGQVEVREQDVPRLVQQDVLGLEVSVHIAQKVQLLQRHQHLCTPTHQWKIMRHCHSCGIMIMTSSAQQRWYLCADAHS